MVRDFQIRILERRDVCHSRRCRIAPESRHDNSWLDLGDRFLQSCSTNNHRTAITTTGGKFSYEWLARQASGFAQKIVAGGRFEAGDHVGLYLDNSVEYVVAFYGSLLAGAAIVPLPRFHNRDKVLQLCEMSDVTLLIDSYDSPVEFSEYFLPENLNFDTASNCQRVERQGKSGGQNSLAMLMFTSGSTGAPKAVMLSHRNLIANCDSICKFLPLNNSDRALVLTPFSHALGNSVLQTHILTGAELVIEDSTKYPTEIIGAISNHACTSITGVPELFEGLVSVAQGKPQSMASVRYMAVAGGKLDPNRAIELQQTIKPAQLFMMYGQTEATARLAYLPPRYLQDAANTIGLPIPNVELAIRNDAGQPVEMGQTGELHARGDNIMLGYWNDATTTSEVLKDGWLNTGDLARRGTDGFIEICGRENGLVKVQGFRFHPTEIEQQVSHALPDVQLIVEPIDFFGKTRLAMFAKPETQRAISLQELRQVCRQVLPAHMIPQQYRICESWPLNLAGKVDRRALVENLLNPIQEKRLAQSPVVTQNNQLTELKHVM